MRLEPRKVQVLGGGKEVNLERDDLCKFLGVDSSNQKILKKIMKCPTYTAIHHTLCGVDSNAKWTRTKACTHNETLRVDFNKTSKVW